MKQFFLLIFLSLMNHVYSVPYKFKGVLYDVNSDETKVLYACKNAINEAYSNGALYILDTKSNVTVEITQIKNMDYNIKSYFINDETILVASYQSIIVFDLNTKTILKSILQLNKHESLISSRKISSTFYITLINYNDSKLSFAKIDSSELTLNKLKSISVTIQPTDNFFDIFLLKDKVWILDNGKLYDEAGSLNQKILFNDREGQFVITSNKSSICFATQTKGGKQIEIISANKVKPIPVNIPIITGQLHIESIRQKEREVFLVSTNKSTYLLDENGNYSKSDSCGIYFGEKINIKKRNLYEMELTLLK